jgi:hypothetical protein
MLISAENAADAIRLSHAAIFGGILPFPNLRLYADAVNKEFVY